MHHTGDLPEPFMINITEKNEGIVLDEDGIRIIAFKMDHGIVKPALGYRIEYKGKVVVISGDTLPCESLTRNSENADILIYAAYSKNWIDRGIKKYSHMRKIANQIMNYQSFTLEAAQVAKKANVKHPVFTHQMPAPTPIWIFERSWVSGAGKIFKNKIIIGRDLMTF
jgi:ribonuclease Z